MKLKVSQYAKMYNCSIRTVWRRITDGSLKIERTSTGRVMIILEELPKQDKSVAIYARVSSAQNKDNLETQKQRLVSYCNAKGYKVAKIVTEIGSGLNDTRPKLEAILLDNSIDLIVVEHKDRLCRFGLNYIQKLLIKQSRDIEIVNPALNDHDDLMQDFVAIIISFTSRLYGKRRSKRNTEKIIQSLKEE